MSSFMRIHDITFYVFKLRHIILNSLIIAFCLILYLLDSSTNTDGYFIHFQSPENDMHYLSILHLKE